MIATLASFVLISTTMAADFKSVSPPGAQVVGPYTPRLVAGRFLCVSGQGAKGAQGRIPPGISAQVKQTLEAVKRIVEAAGPTPDHLVVFVNPHLAGTVQSPAMNRASAKRFKFGDTPGGRSR